MNNTEEFTAGFDIDETQIPKKQKKKPWVLIGIIIAVVASVFVFIYFKMKLSPSERLIKGYTELFKASEDSIYDALGAEEIRQSKTSTTNTEFSIDSCNYMPKASGIGANLMVAKNTDKKKLEAITGLTYCGTPVMSSDIYVKNNTCYIRVPSLFDEVLSIDLSKIEELKDSSYILQQIPEEVYENIDMSQFQDIWKKKFNKLNPITMADYIKKTSPAKWKKISDGIQITETENKNEIKLSISAKAIKLFLNKSMEILLEDDAFTANIKEFLKQAGISYSEDIVKDSMERAISMISLFFKNGLDIYTELNAKNQITNIRCGSKFSLFGIKLKLDMNAGFTGSKRPKDKYDGTVLLSYNDYAVRFEFGRDYKVKDNKVAVSHSYGLKNNDTSILNIHTKCDYRKLYTDNAFLNFIGCSKSPASTDNTFTEYNASVSVSSAFLIPSFELTASGNISDVSKGECFTVNADTIELKSGTESLLSLSGSYSISKKASGINKPDGDISNLLEMEKKDFMKLKSQIYKNINKLEKSFSELTD